MCTVGEALLCERRVADLRPSFVASPVPTPRVPGMVFSPVVVIERFPLPDRHQIARLTVSLRLSFSSIYASGM